MSSSAAYKTDEAQVQVDGVSVGRGRHAYRPSVGGYLAYIHSRSRLVTSLLCHDPSGRSSHAHFPKPRREMNSAVSLVVLSCLLTGVQCRSTGAPDAACAGVSPDPSAHLGGPQTSTVPYVLTGLPPNGNYTPGMPYTRECPNPRTSAYLTPNCRSQTCLYQCTNTLDEYTALVRRTQAFYTSVFQLTKAYMPETS